MESIFVYGKKVHDFRAVDYDRIFTTGIGAIQEMYKVITKQQAAIDVLEVKVSEIDQLKSEINSISKQLGLAGVAENDAKTK